MDHRNAMYIPMIEILFCCFFITDPFCSQLSFRMGQWGVTKQDYSVGNQSSHSENHLSMPAKKP